MERNDRKERIGIVISDKMSKSVIVKVERQYMHPVYGRRMRDWKKFVAHDEKEECHVGDTVRITETRPLSKTKRWRVSEVITRAK